jgi:eukaryotic-like serine/threonine-protein kinase
MRDDTIGHYRIVRTLAEGGMAVLHEALDLRTGARVALKTLRQDAVHEVTLRARFAREVRAMQLLSGRHVMRALDSGEANGAPFVVMELLEGRDLAQEIKAGPLAIADAAAVMVEVACGVAHAHTRGIVHRDLKPANVFLAKDGAGRVAKVLDFGVAKLEGASDDELTHSLSSIGTPAYMSPEQIRTPRDVDRRTDVWSFSLVLFRALAGRLPFSGNASSIPVAICNDPPLSLRTLRADVPGDIADVVAAGLEKDRRLRPTLADIGDVLIAHVDASADAAIAHDAYEELARLSLVELNARDLEG